MADCMQCPNTCPANTSYCDSCMADMEHERDRRYGFSAQVYDALHEEREEDGWDEPMRWTIFDTGLLAFVAIGLAFLIVKLFPL